jgi:hypothetical protein
MPASFSRRQVLLSCEVAQELLRNAQVLLRQNFYKLGFLEILIIFLKAYIELVMLRQ